MMRRVQLHVLVLCGVASSVPAMLRAQAKPIRSASVPSASVARDSLAADSVTRAFLEAEERFFLRRLLAQRTVYLKRASWADLGTRCNPGALRVFPRDTSAMQLDSMQKLVQHMEQTIIGRGAGSRLDTPTAQQLLRTVLGWEAGIDRPYWDSDEKRSRRAIATGLTGDVPDPKGRGCLASPLARDTVTFVLPGFTTMEFPKAPRPRVNAYFGPEGQRHARDEFFTAVGSKDPTAELSYAIIAPVVIWRGWALVGVDRPREKGGVEIGKASNGGAVYMMRRVGTQWRLLAIVRSWGS